MQPFCVLRETCYTDFATLLKACSRRGGACFWKRPLLVFLFRFQCLLDFFSGTWTLALRFDLRSFQGPVLWQFDTEMQSRALKCQTPLVFQGLTEAGPTPLWETRGLRLGARTPGLWKVTTSRKRKKPSSLQPSEESTSLHCGTLAFVTSPASVTSVQACR